MYFKEGCTDPSQETIGPEGSNRFSRGSVPVFLRKHIHETTSEFTGGRDPLSLPMDPLMAYLRKTYNYI